MFIINHLANFITMTSFIIWKKSNIYKCLITLNLGIDLMKIWQKVKNQRRRTFWRVVIFNYKISLISRSNCQINLIIFNHTKCKSNTKQSIYDCQICIIILKNTRCKFIHLMQWYFEDFILKIFNFSHLLLDWARFLYLD